MSVHLEALRAHLLADEQLAKDAGGDYGAGWEATTVDSSLWRIWLVDEDELEIDPHREQPAKHIARHDPSRVLRWVAAARKVLAEYERAATPGNALAGEGYVGYVLGVRFAVEAIASVYGEEG